MYLTHTTVKVRIKEITNLQYQLLNFSPSSVLFLSGLGDWCSPGLCALHPCMSVPSYNELHDDLNSIYLCKYSLHSELLGCREPLVIFCQRPALTSYILECLENVASDIRKLNSKIRNQVNIMHSNFFSHIYSSLLPQSNQNDFFQKIHLIILCPPSRQLARGPAGPGWCLCLLASLLFLSLLSTHTLASHLCSLVDCAENTLPYHISTLSLRLLCLKASPNLFPLIHSLKRSYFPLQE